MALTNNLAFEVIISPQRALVQECLLPEDVYGLESVNRSMQEVVQEAAMWVELVKREYPGLLFSTAFSSVSIPERKTLLKVFRKATIPSGCFVEINDVKTARNLLLAIKAATSSAVEMMTTTEGYHYNYYVTAAKVVILNMPQSYFLDKRGKQFVDNKTISKRFAKAVQNHQCQKRDENVPLQDYAIDIHFANDDGRCLQGAYLAIPASDDANPYARCMKVAENVGRACAPKTNKRSCPVAFVVSDPIQSVSVVTIRPRRFTWQDSRLLYALNIEPTGGHHPSSR
jgi:hypothetical protein